MRRGVQGVHLQQRDGGRWTTNGWDFRWFCVFLGMLQSLTIFDMHCAFGMGLNIVPPKSVGLWCGLQECLRLWIKTNAQQGGIPRCPGGCTQKVSRPASCFFLFLRRIPTFWWLGASFLEWSDYFFVILYIFFSIFEIQCTKIICKFCFWLVHLFALRHFVMPSRSGSSWDLLTPPSSSLFQGSLSLATTLDLPTKGYGAIGTRKVGSENEGTVKRWKAGTLLLDKILHHFNDRTRELNTRMIWDIYIYLPKSTTNHGNRDSTIQDPIYYQCTSTPSLCFFSTFQSNSSASKIKQHVILSDFYHLYLFDTYIIVR